MTTLKKGVESKGTVKEKRAEPGRCRGGFHPTTAPGEVDLYIYYSLVGTLKLGVHLFVMPGLHLP